MTFNDFMIVGESVKNSADIIDKLNNRKPVFSHVLVVNNKGNLEVYPALEFMQQKLCDLDIDIVAIFKSEDEALEFVRTLCDISLKRFGKIELISALPFYEEEVM